ncbi:MAG TPA: FHA domain-containing protein [Burkholderiaceae bacterium]|jgi:pSer/pThr/pTyr-binding forkhead associated (FHA) protein
MAKIVLSMDGVVLQEMMLSKERITIGRRPHNDLIIDNSAISAEHAVIVTMLNDAFLEDLNSTNGTRINGQPIKKHFLKNNDVIELAKYKIRFVNDEEYKNDGHTYLRTPESIPALSTHKVVKATHQSPDDYQDINTEVLFGSGLQSTAAIKILSGTNAGEEIALTKPLTTIGLPGIQVAVITSRGHAYSLTHVEGDSYPVVNEKNIGSSAYLMKSGDVIELAGTKMEFLQK